MKSPILDSFSFMGGMLLKEIIPKNSVVESYFLYSGEIEIDLCSKERLVISHTSKYPTYEFWWMAKNQPRRIASMAESIFPGLSIEMLYRFQENWHKQRDPVYRAALFYILNRCSKENQVSSGALDRRRLSPITTSRFKKLSINNFHVILDKSQDLYTRINNNIKSDIRLFPVGDFGLNMLDAGSEGSYEQEYINHQQLYDTLSAEKFNWVVLYKYHKKVIQRYKDYNIIMVDKYGNQTTQQDNCEDIIVTNF
tara:strand:- start:502 stop:1260 length:759 start_codon:yes stop_codon:yes gene_type:complete